MAASLIPWLRLADLNNPATDARWANTVLKNFWKSAQFANWCVREKTPFVLLALLTLVPGSLAKASEAHARGLVQLGVLGPKEASKLSNELERLIKLLGKETEIVNYCTEAPFIQEVCPTLVLGPGSINQAHQPDEYIDTAFIKPTRELITQVINHFCYQYPYMVEKT